MRILLAPALLVSICTTSAAFAEETRLAAILPLTGNAADQGEWARRGFELARDELQTSEETKVSLLYEDSHGADPGSAVKADENGADG